MGVVFSCLASTFMWTGVLLENIILAISEIGTTLLRGVFALIVGLCDWLASISCCCAVPWYERPDRRSFHRSRVVSEGGIFYAYLTVLGREARKQVREAKHKERDLLREERRNQKEADKALKAKEKLAAETKKQKKAEEKAEKA